MSAIAAHPVVLEPYQFHSLDYLVCHNGDLTVLWHVAGRSRVSCLENVSPTLNSCLPILIARSLSRFLEGEIVAFIPERIPDMDMVEKGVSKLEMEDQWSCLDCH